MRKIIALGLLLLIGPSAYAGSVSPAPGLLPSKNLSDVTSTSTALTNLGGIPTTSSGAANGVAPLDSSSNVPLANLGNTLSGLDNRIIDGDFNFDQYNAAATTTPSTTGGVYVTDRWNYVATNASYISFTAGSQTVATPNGGYYLKMISQAANTVNSGDSYYTQQKIEGPNIYDFGWSTSSGKAIQVEFQFEANNAGPYCVSLASTGTSFSYVHSFAYTNTGAWQKVQFTVAAPTSNSAWFATAGSTGLRLRFDQGSGSTFQNASVDTWLSGDYRSTSGCTKLVTINAAAMGITNVRLYPASSPLPYAPRTFGEEIALAQRYYQKSFNTGTAPVAQVAVGALQSIAPVSGGNALIPITFREPMMAAPTMTYFNPVNSGALCYDVTAANNGGTPASTNIGTNTLTITCPNTGTGHAAGDTIEVQWTAKAEL